MTATKNYGRVRKLDDLKRLVDKLGETDGPIGFDLETGYDGPERERGALAVHYEHQFIAGFSFTSDPKWARYVPLRHEYADNLDPDVVWPLMAPLLAQQRWVAHNAKFEKLNLRKIGLDIGIVGDTIIQAYVLSEWQLVGLKPLVEAVFGHKMLKLKDLFPQVPDNKIRAISFAALGLTPDVVRYACEDSAWALELHLRHHQRCLDERGFVYRMEMGIMELLCDLEWRGVEVDWEGMAKARAEGELFAPRVEADVKAQLGALVGSSLSALKLNSTKQMQELLYARPERGGLGLPVGRKTKGGKPSTDAVALEKLSRQYPAIRQLLNYREVNVALKRTDLWLEADKKKAPVRGADGRVHANYNQTRVGTGRFAATEPPIQQLPKKWFWSVGSANEAFVKTEEPKKKQAAARDAAEPGEIWEGNFRNYVIAGPGTYLIGFDYSQIELRVMAGLAQEKSLLDAFEKGDDVHSLTASQMLNKRPQDLDAETERPIGKTMNFALLYGMGTGSLADRLAISNDRSKELYEAYFAAFPSIATWKQKVQNEGRNAGFTLSWCGRKWTIWELQASSHAQFAKGERMLVNSPVQGGAADYVKVAMLKAQKKLQAEGMWGTTAMMVMNQHDALIFEVDQSVSPADFRALLDPAVTFPLDWLPEIVADWEFGYRWGSMRKMSAETEFVRDAQDLWKFAGDGGPAPPPSEDYDLPGTYAADEGDGLMAELLAVPDFDTSILETVLPKAESNITDAPIEEGRVVRVELREDPTENDFAKLLGLLAQNPGPNRIRIVTPEGEALLAQTTKLDVRDAGRIAVALPGARCSREEVDEVAFASIEL